MPSVEASPPALANRNAAADHTAIRLYGSTAIRNALAWSMQDGVDGSASSGLGGQSRHGGSWRLAPVPRDGAHQSRKPPSIWSIGVTPWLRSERRQWCWWRAPTPRCSVYVPRRPPTFSLYASPPRLCFCQL